LLANPFFLAVKAALASLLALALCGIVGNPDTISAAFVAVLCVSPTVLMGLRRAAGQLLGSAVGGLFGIGATLLALPVWIGVPLSIALSVRIVYAAGAGVAYPVAAFSALLIQIAPMDSPADTLDHRMVAVVLAAVSGFLVNLVVSGLAYEEIFGRRLALVENLVMRLLPQAATRGPEAAQQGFTAIAEVQAELSLALEELRWRQNWRNLRLIENAWWRAGRLRHLLHVATEMGYGAQTSGVPPEALAPFLDWVRHQSGERPEVPDPLEPSARRILQELIALRGGAHAEE
jgi:uncharacterized membrane protein YccC